jgi:protein-S-isoprenylcysteine O-methyltransferase Ste14
MVADSTRPNVLPWPPMIVALAAAASIVLAAWLPLRLPDSQLITWPGLLLAAFGLGNDAWAIVTMRKADTNVLPHRAADRLVTSGPFRYSRNPIYLGNTSLLLGIGLAFGNGWFVISAFVVAGLVDRLAIRREERHLALRFGREWTDYASRTPRWLLK